MQISHFYHVLSDLAKSFGLFCSLSAELIIFNSFFLSHRLSMSDVTQGLLTRLFVNVYLDELRVVVKASMSAFHSTENGQVVQVFPLQLLFE